MKIKKYLSYCYPTSPLSEVLGNHGYYVAKSIQREDMSWSPDEPAFTGDGAFDNLCEPTILALLNECDGAYAPEHCHSKRYNADQLIKLHLALTDKGYEPVFTVDSKTLQCGVQIISQTAKGSLVYTNKHKEGINFGTKNDAQHFIDSIK